VSLTTYAPASPLRGARRPRVDVHPPFTRSFGREAVELAASAGLILDPWQADAMQVMLGIRADGRWACFEYAEWVPRQNGKGAIFECRALAGLFLFGERLIMWSAHEYKTAMELFLRIRDLVDGSDDLRRQVRKINNTNGEEGIELLTGQRLRFVARSKGSGRGFSGDTNLIDEAFAYTRLQQSALMPTMSARPNPQVCYASSPPLTGETGEVMYDLRERADAGGDDSLGYRDWGVPGDLANLDRVDLDQGQLAAAANPALGGRISHEFVLRERRAMSDEDYARERLGMWPQRVGVGGPVFQVIREPDWQDAYAPPEPLVGRCAVAAAVSLDRSRASIAEAGRRNDGLLQVRITGDGGQMDNRGGTGWVVPRWRELHAAGCRIVADEFGAVGSLIVEAEREGIPVDRMGTADVARAFGMFYDGVAGTDPTSRNVRHVGQQELTDAVAYATTRPLGDRRTWDLKNATADITSVVAATNALWGYLTMPQDDAPPNLW
jgi:hypothetical protein